MRRRRSKRSNRRRSKSSRGRGEEERECKQQTLPSKPSSGQALQNDTSVSSHNASIVLGADLNWPWTFQHAVKDGLGMSAMIWNHVNMDNNVHQIYTSSQECSRNFISISWEEVRVTY